MKKPNKILFSILEHRHILNEQIGQDTAKNIGKSIVSELRPEAEAAARRARIAFQELIDRMAGREASIIVQRTLPKEIEQALKNEFKNLHSMAPTTEDALMAFYKNHPELNEAQLEEVVSDLLQQSIVRDRPSVTPEKPPYELPPFKPEEFPTRPDEFSMPGERPTEEIELVPGQKPWSPRGLPSAEPTTELQLAKPTTQKLTVRSTDVSDDVEDEETLERQKERQREKQKEKTSTDTEDETEDKKKPRIIFAAKYQQPKNRDVDAGPQDTDSPDIDPDISLDRYLGKYAGTYRIR